MPVKEKRENQPFEISTLISVGSGAIFFLLVFVGVVTGVGGGVLRDVLAGERPYIFVKHVYATASLLGALVFLAVRAAAGFT